MSGFTDESDVCVSKVGGVGAAGRGMGGVANNQPRYTNLRWQHLVYLKLKGQLY